VRQGLRAAARSLPGYEWARRLRRWAEQAKPAPTEWELVPGGWSAQDEASGGTASGWHVDAIAEAYRRKWPLFIEAIDGPGPLGVAHEIREERSQMPRNDPLAQNIVLAFGHVLSLAAHRRHELSVLDWGGATGHYYELARRLFEDVDFDYHCLELPSVCAVGRELVPDVTFHEDDGCLERRYELVVASGSLQCVEDWSGLLRRLAAAADPWLFITRVPVVERSPGFVALQRARAYGYETELLNWVFDRDELVQAATSEGFELVREYVLGYPMPIEGAPQNPTFTGLLLRRVTT
jgi:putative methyltransferase (TIGR04325 family)